MTTWIDNGDGARIGVVPCDLHPDHAQAVMVGSIVFKMGEEAIGDVRQASICLTRENLHALAAQANLVAYEIEGRIADRGRLSPEA